MLRTVVRRGPHVRLPPNATVFPFGTGRTDANKALLRFPEQGWTIDEGNSEGWAVVGDSEGRRLAVETLLGRHRILPPVPQPGGALPVSHSPPPPSIDADAWRAVRYLAFARPASSGEFTDYTARYGALLDEDRLSLREKLSRSAMALPGQADRPIPPDVMHQALELMGLTHLADLPAIALSSGQTRRARIAHALMYRPKLLLLEDPMAGLDVRSREEVRGLLGDMNAKGSPRVVLVLRDRGEDTLAEWVNCVVDVRQGRVWVGGREEWMERRRERERVPSSSLPQSTTSATSATSAAAATTTATSATSATSSADADADAASSAADAEPEPLIDLKDVSVSYASGARPVLRNITWRILPGSRWHLQGSNGSGKTTLLSLLLGLHPQSYSLPSTSLTLFGKPRRSIPTTILKRRVGHSSPEIFASFPRNMGLSAYDAIGTGFEGVFSRRSLSPEQRERVLGLIGRFKELLKGPRDGEDVDTKVIARREFSHFTPPQQALLVFLRAVVGRPEVLVLDEPTQGMDEEIWEECRAFLKEEWGEIGEDGRLRGERQAVIVVSHYEDEVPWRDGRVLRLEEGRAHIE